MRRMCRRYQGPLSEAPRPEWSGALMGRTHTGRVPGGHPAASLPPDTIAEGVRRLGWIALVYAIAYVAGPFTRLVLTGVAGTIDSYEFVIPDVFSVAAVVMGLAIFAMARRGVLSSSRLLDLGLVFQVGGALGIAVREFWHGVPLQSGISFSIKGAGNSKELLAGQGGAFGHGPELGPDDGPVDLDRGAQSLALGPFWIAAATAIGRAAGMPLSDARETGEKGANSVFGGRASETTQCARHQSAAPPLSIGRQSARSALATHWVRIGSCRARAIQRCRRARRDHCVRRAVPRHGAAVR